MLKFTFVMFLRRLLLCLAILTVHYFAVFIPIAEFFCQAEMV